MGGNCVYVAAAARNTPILALWWLLLKKDLELKLPPPLARKSQGFRIPGF